MMALLQLLLIVVVLILLWQERCRTQRIEARVVVLHAAVSRARAEPVAVASPPPAPSELLAAPPRREKPPRAPQLEPVRVVAVVKGAGEEFGTKLRNGVPALHCHDPHGPGVLRYTGIRDEQGRYVYERRLNVDGD